MPKGIEHLPRVGVIRGMQPWKWLPITTLAVATPPGLMRLFAWDPREVAMPSAYAPTQGLVMMRPRRGLPPEEVNQSKWADILDILGNFDYLAALMDLVVLSNLPMLPTLRVKRCCRM